MRGITIQTFSRIVGIVLTNAIPMIGVVFFDWNLLSILELFWFESVCMGVVNFLRIARRNEGMSHRLSLFFLLHYTIFLIASFVLFKELYPGFLSSLGEGQWYLFSIDWVRELFLGKNTPFSLLVMSYVGSFIKEVYDTRKKSIGSYLQLTFFVYARIFAMFYTCMFGIYLVNVFGVQALMLSCIFLIRTALDLFFFEKKE